MKNIINLIVEENSHKLRIDTFISQKCSEISRTRIKNLIINRKIDAHKNVMLTCFGTSTLFLVSYVVYHWFKSGPKLYEGDFKTTYYIILFSHIVLAAIIIPLALFTLYRGWNNQLEKHRKIAKITLPIWLYVSVTGVVIYLMLY